MQSLPTKRFKLTIPYRGSEHSVVVSVSPTKTGGVILARLPDGKTVHIERDELDLLIRCGIAKEIP